MCKNILWTALKFRAAYFIMWIKMFMAVSRRYRHVSIGQQTVIKKILLYTAEYSVHEYELSIHLLKLPTLKMGFAP